MTISLQAPSKGFARRLLLALGLAALHASALAEFPDRPIKWVVPFPPGGAVDVISRIVAQQMTQNIGRPVTVENRPGSGGMIGTDFVAKAAPDGYTIMINSTGLAVDKWFYEKVPYESTRDLAPVVLLASVPSVLVVHPSVPATSVEQLVALARANPGKYTFATAGKGTSVHLAPALFAARANISLLHVPYKGSGAAVSDLLSGRVSMMVDSVTAQRQNIQAGLLRPLAVTSAIPSHILPQVPTMAVAANLPGYEVVTWCGIFTTAGTPPEVIARLNLELNKAVQATEVKKQLESLGVRTEGGTSQALGSLLRQEIDRWGKVIPQYKLNAD